MEGVPWIIDAVKDVVIPFLALVGGWFGHMFRSKQKKEQDILSNVQQILTMQQSYIAEQDGRNKKNVDMIARLERKLDGKRESIRKANGCKFTNEGDGCPVLHNEDRLDDKCRECVLNKDENADSKD